MYFYNGDKDNPQNSSGQTFDDLMNDWDDNIFFGMSHSLPTQPFENINFENTSPNQQDFHLNENYTLDSSLFVDTSDQTSIQDLDLVLASDLTFSRQQHIFQEHQKIKEQPHSNLSAMLSVDKSQSIQPINLITSQQQSQNILNRRSSNLAEPIPIITTTNHNTQSSVDHQRRLNELQARFRVNNIKNANKQSNKAALGTSIPNTMNDKSFTTERRRLSFEPVSTGSKPIIKLVGGINRTKSRSPVTIPTNSSNSNFNNALSSSFPSRTMPIQIQRQHRPNSMTGFDLEARQKKLDEQLVKTDFDDITVSELKEMLRQRGKPATGKKVVLVQRLQEERDAILLTRKSGLLIPNRSTDYPSSLPDTLSSSPSGVIGSLNRSIADLHIDSPPVQQFRRFSPYGTSPRQNLAPTYNSKNSNSSFLYSSSLPVGNFDTVISGQKWEGEPKNETHIPFTPPELATPDQENDGNPFDLVKPGNTPQQQQAMILDSEMDWLDPDWEHMLPQGNLY